jgi:hypothetical protein
LREFRTGRNAKEFLIERIIAEAKTEGIPLSEVERQVLYFTETGWNFPNMMEVNAEFERDYDSDEYEQKIAALAREIDKRNDIVGGEQQSDWDDAVVKLSEGDHYLLLLIGIGRSEASKPPRQESSWMPSFDPAIARPRGDFLRLIIVAFAVLLIGALVAWVKDR